MKGDIVSDGICNKAFKNTHNLRRHAIAQHEQYSEKLWGCGKCNHKDASALEVALHAVIFCEEYTWKDPTVYELYRVTFIYNPEERTHRLARKKKCLWLLESLKPHVQAG